MKKNANLKIEYLPIDALTPYEKNARKHADFDVEQIAASIERYGFDDPIGVWGEKNIIVEGHGRLLAAKKLGMESVPCIRLDHLTEKERREYAIAHNRTAELSLWESEFLRDERAELDMDWLDFDGIDSVADFLTEQMNDIVKDDSELDLRDPSMQHGTFENQDVMQFPCVGEYGIPVMQPTETVGHDFVRFMDWKEVENPQDYIAHFYYDDYKFISSWREPEKYIERLRQFKAVVSPDFSLYTDFPRVLQILSCYRRQWCGAYWQYLGIDVIPDVVWGDKKSFDFCFDGIPQGGTVAVSSVGVKRDNNWNNKSGDMFKAGFDEMVRRLQPKTILFYGDMIDGLEGNIVQIPSYYAEKREMLNEKARRRSRNG